MLQSPHFPFRDVRVAPCSLLKRLVFTNISFLSRLFPFPLLLESLWKTAISSWFLTLSLLPRQMSFWTSRPTFPIAPWTISLDIIQEFRIWHLPTPYSPPTKLSLIWVLSFCHQKLWSWLWLPAPQPPFPFCQPMAYWNKEVYLEFSSLHVPSQTLADSLPWTVEKASLWTFGLKSYLPKPSLLSSQSTELTTSRPFWKFLRASWSTE